MKDVHQEELEELKVQSAPLVQMTFFAKSGFLEFIDNL